MPGKNSSRARRYINAPPTSGEALLLIFSQAGGFFAFGKALRDKCSCRLSQTGGEFFSQAGGLCSYRLPD